MIIVLFWIAVVLSVLALAIFGFTFAVKSEARNYLTLMAIFLDGLAVETFLSVVFFALRREVYLLPAIAVSVVAATILIGLCIFFYAIYHDDLKKKSTP